MARQVLMPLTNAERAMLRIVIDQMIAQVRDSTPNVDDRLASFFGGMCGRAGFDPSANKLEQLWAETSNGDAPK
jgi:hypothetical protein